MAEDKGKGRAEHDETAPKVQSGARPVDSEPSMISRVAASATGLTRSAFAASNGNEFNERAASTLSEKVQIGQPSKSSSAWAESSRAAQSQGQLSGTSTSGLRVGHNEEHIRQSENEFSSFLDGIDSFTPSQDTGDNHHGRETLGNDFGEAWLRSQPSKDPLLQQQFHGSVAEQQQRDGAGVLELLSQSGTVENDFEADVESYDWGLSAEQIQQIRAMTAELFPSNEIHKALDSDSPLNLAPNFGNAYGQPAVGTENWREQWDGVLNRYADEVWGGLLPLVKEARKEVEEIGSSHPNAEQPKALRRLGAILGHLKQY